MHNNLESIIIKDLSVSGEGFTLIKNKSYGYYETHPKPQLENLDSYYKSQDYISHTNLKRSFFERIYHIIRYYTIRRKLDLINSFKTVSKTLLDVGCGTGSFISHANKRLWNVTGIEPNLKARSNCDPDIKSFVFNTKELDRLSKSSFDVITLWHVMEHIYNLEEQMSLICSLLKTKGKLVLALPNYKSFDSRYYKNFWAAFDVPRHLYHFDQDSVETFFHDRGLRLIKAKPMLFDAFYVSILSERFKKNKFSFMRGILIGLVSNLKAIYSGEFSSKIYILEKEAF